MEPVFVLVGYGADERVKFERIIPAHRVEQAFALIGEGVDPYAAYKVERPEEMQAVVGPFPLDDLEFFIEAYAR